MMTIDFVLEYFNERRYDSLIAALYILKITASEENYGDLPVIPDEIINEIDDLISIFYEENKVVIFDSNGKKDYTEYVIKWIEHMGKID